MSLAVYIWDTPLPQGYLDFLRANGDRRITQSAFDFYAHPDASYIAVVREVDHGAPLALSLAKITGKDFKVEHSITVTSRDHRNKGYGTDVLNFKISCLARMGQEYEAIVADDNAPSQRICVKNNLKPVQTLTRTRRSGEFTATLFKETNLE
jgi:RimJ/RimL family protein N-acetyltransferase